MRSVRGHIWILIVFIIVSLQICQLDSFRFKLRLPFQTTSSQRTIATDQRATVALFAGFGKTPIKSSTPIITTDTICPCGSEKVYNDCCKAYHSLNSYPSPESLVRSRFTAFRLKDIDYLLNTTHKLNFEYASAEQKSKRKAWERTVRKFADENEFLSLHIVNSEESDADATVTFRVKIRRVDDDTNFEYTEISSFKKDDDNSRWLYASGDVSRSIIV